MSAKNKRRQPTTEGDGLESEVTTKALAKSEQKPNDEAAAAAERAVQKRIAIFGFGFLGLMMGFLWGANAVVQVAATPVALLQALRVGVAVATNAPELGSGLAMGLAGMLFGSTFGYSLFLRPAHMFLGWVGGSVGLACGALLGGTIFGGLGWAGGFLAVMAGTVKYYVSRG